MHLIRLLDSIVWLVREAVTLPALYCNHTFDPDCALMAASIDSANSTVIFVKIAWHTSSNSPYFGWYNEFNGLAKPAEVDFAGIKQLSWCLVY